MMRTSRIRERDTEMVCSGKHLNSCPGRRRMRARPVSELKRLGVRVQRNKPGFKLPRYVYFQNYHLVFWSRFLKSYTEETPS
jgi:hypothetical protein